MALTAALVTAANVTSEDAKYNQNNTTMTNSGLVYTLRGDCDTLKTYEGGDGSHQYVGVLVNTGESSIIGISVNGTALTESDVSEAATVGGAAGTFVYWAEADVLKNVSAGRVFTLTKTGKTATTITFKWDEVNG